MLPRKSSDKRRNNNDHNRNNGNNNYRICKNKFEISLFNQIKQQLRKERITGKQRTHLAQAKKKTN